MSELFLCFILVIALLNLASSELYTQSKDVSSRIVNGYEVDISEIPYQASLRRKVVSGWVHSCGAVLISERTILTAAHCVTEYSTDFSVIRAVVGTSYRSTGGRSYDISNIQIHDDYSETTLENDIAVVVVNSIIKFGKKIQPIAFAPSNYVLEDESSALVSGFGTTEYEGSASTVLLAAVVQTVSNKDCSESYLHIAAITSGMLCAGSTNPSSDACQGDSGGPLVSDGVLVGIVSWGESCADVLYPGVYTRVSSYYTWINDVIKDI